MSNDQSPRQRLDLRWTMTDARQWLVEVEDNPFMTDADRVAALTARNTAGNRWWWQFPDGSIVERLDTERKNWGAYRTTAAGRGASIRLRRCWRCTCWRC